MTGENVASNIHPFIILSPSLQYVFDYHDGDVFGCVADIGWITGHSYVVYGPLCNGGTTVLFESTPVYPNPGKLYTYQTQETTTGKTRLSYLCVADMANMRGPGFLFVLSQIGMHM